MCSSTGWVESAALKKVRGKGETLQFLFKAAAVSDSDLRELIAFFQRYGLDQSPLKQFLNAENSGWFRDNNRAFWHAAIFGGE